MSATGHHDGGDENMGGNAGRSVWRNVYTLGRLANPFSGIDDLFEAKKKLEKDLKALDKWEGHWPLAERIWVRRQVDKLVFAMNQFLEDEIDEDVSTVITSTVDEMSALLGQVYTGAFSAAPGALEEAPRLAGYIASTFGEAGRAEQHDRSLATLYERCWVTHRKNMLSLEAVRYMDEFPQTAELLYEPIKPLFEAVESMVSRTLTHDARLSHDLVKTTAVLDKLSDFVPVLRALQLSDDVDIIEVCDGVSTPRKDGWRDVIVHYTLADDEGGLICQLQLVLRPLYAARPHQDDQAQFSRLQCILSCIQLKATQSAGSPEAAGPFMEPFLAELKRRREKARQDGDMLEGAEIDTVIAHANAIQVEANKTRNKISQLSEAGDATAAAEARRRLVALNKRFRGIDDDMISPEAKPAAVGPDGKRSVHPDYPDLPTDYLRDWKYNHMINLDYPGLQLIYKSQGTGAPIFIIPNFLSENECEKCLAKVSGQLTLSSTTEGLIRTSAHVRPLKRETPGLHARLANLTNHSVDNMETAKIMRYQKGHQFGKHTDLSADRPVNVDGSAPPPHTNREITCFVYLNTVEHGGETSFYSEAVHLNANGTKVVKQGKEMHGDLSHQVCSIRPERGMLVLFFPSANPPDGGPLPEVTLPGNQMVWPFSDPSRTAFCYDDMWHRGSEAVDEKYLMSIWVWPPSVRAPSHPEERSTDGIPI
eukprot:m.178774 g.178774  ORF g.178774 m.178774 type:complete len:707 (+) comp14618_c0_seq1:242-2362(+)